jgi:hypothetical protein
MTFCAIAMNVSQIAPVHCLHPLIITIASFLLVPFIQAGLYPHSLPPRTTLLHVAILFMTQYAPRVPLTFYKLGSLYHINYTFHSGAIILLDIQTFPWLIFWNSGSR